MTINSRGKFLSEKCCRTRERVYMAAPSIDKLVQLSSARLISLHNISSVDFISKSDDFYYYYYRRERGERWSTGLAPRFWFIMISFPSGSCNHWQISFWPLIQLVWFTLNLRWIYQSGNGLLRLNRVFRHEDMTLTCRAWWSMSSW